VYVFEKSEMKSLIAKRFSIFSLKPRLVAVSKNKSIELIRACYDAGHRHFGENYVQELIAKYKQVLLFSSLSSFSQDRH
jgi:uncharacterized pyridoxal phosphate-containing UPF0001 family protein